MVNGGHHTIYVRFLDGADAFYPAKAKKLKDETYKIETIDEFDPEDTATLFEFIPGDIVSAKWYKYSNRIRNHERATHLIQPSDHPLKGYLEFLFKAAWKKIELNLTSAKKYKSYIKQVQQDVQAGKFFYHYIIETVKVLQTLQQTS